MRVLRQHRQAAIGEAASRGCRHPVAAGLRQSADSIDCRDPPPNYQVTRTDQRQGFLLFDGRGRSVVGSPDQAGHNPRAFRHRPDRSCG
jgi:hypothetical protein